MLPRLLAVVWVAVAAASASWGLDYYALPPAERVYSSLAPTFSPSGSVGHGFGIVGSAMMAVGVAGYAARKRMAALSNAGAIRHWLQIHIFLCTLGPFLVLLHTTFKFGGIVSIAFWSMVVVVVSGIFGRYLYVRIPKTINGAFLTLEAVRQRADDLAARAREAAGLSSEDLDGLFGARQRATPSSLTGALGMAFREDIRFRSRRRAARRLLKAREVSGDLHREVLALALEGARARQQAILLRPFQRLFGYWHVFHLPLAVLMFAILAVHVAVAVLFGYTWVF